MDIRRTITLIDNAYHAQVSVESLTVVDQDAVARFGQWPIDLGGVFDDGEGLEFELPLQVRYFPTQRVAKSIFYISDALAADRTLLWVDTIVQRLVEAQAAALGKDPRNILDTITTYPEIV